MGDDGHGGLRGLITRRASDWWVDRRDERFRRRQSPFWNLVMDHYFRMEVEGWHRLPKPPALLLPQIPLPAKIRTEFLDPIELDPDPARADDKRYVSIKYREVERKLQAGVDRLAARRSFPVFG